MRRPTLEEKEVFNPEEAIVFYDLSRRKFRRLIQQDAKVSFLAFYNNRRLIIRSEFEKYLEAHPEIKEGLKNGRPPVPKKA